jgi:putative acetyltransferase
MPDIILSRADPEEARPLLEASHALMRALFAPEENHFLSFEALRADSIRFFAARDPGGAMLGCGALALKDGYGEVKSMFTAQAARGRGVAARMLARLEEEARAEGLAVLRLETGDKLEAAHRVYARAGFATRGPFGAYTANGSSVFMEKAL